MIRRLLPAMLVVAVACGGGGGAAQPGDAAKVEAEVRAAYLEAWDARDEAVARADTSLLDARFTDGDPSEIVGNLPRGTPSALEVVSESVAARVAAGVDVEGDVEHTIRTVQVNDDASAAQVEATIADRTYLVDRTTRAAVSSSEETRYDEVWFLVRRDGVWKVLYFVRG